ncbi:adenosylcobinamide-phosphate synthase CbiB [Mameliella sp. AT18]|uniref:adenosylcobinamide-phosphate synthase CbiB n=1 Tax=Mameliella sp. AT18 TaxID=3028385 RepID=UPI000841013C|nr:adenosylcobinamide-phosphate synthase CbiB [Mameliella sp. AT18]MDD9728412.1 adenosylcobinamide-phosphate synthase CbiB [Mameliella sp. AT18]ODM48136.1 cobalamin biosynthesis protein CobD [Ruegeria sp. PBVC088]
MIFAQVMLIGLLLDVALGWSSALFRRLSHPVVWIGSLISALEARLNKGGARRRFATGLLTVMLVLLVSVCPAVLVTVVLGKGWAAVLVLGVLAWPLIAVRSMYEHVAAVRDPLLAGDPPAARHALSMIVGRDPSALDDAGISRAALESLAENTSDGIVAPLFWGVVAGLPGIVAYKAINTMDSMIGHRNDRYEHFGKVAARLDDLVNLVPARLTSLVFALAANGFWRSLRVVSQDAARHRSPNAGWPEAALAGGLGVRLSGPRIYGDRVAQEPWVNEGAADPEARDIARGLALYVRAMFLCGAVLTGLAIL